MMDSSLGGESKSEMLADIPGRVGELFNTLKVACIIACSASPSILCYHSRMMIRLKKSTSDSFIEGGLKTNTDALDFLA